MHQKLPVFVATALAVTLTVTTSGSSPDTDRKIVHVLNRIAFGPRPGDLERVERLGVDRYIDQQLHPERIDDAAMKAKVAGLRTLSLSSRQIADEYERPMLVARRERAAAAASSSDGVTAPQPREQAAANLPLIELSQQKLLRAVFSERQLQEVLTDFWFNHFNVDARKGPERYLLTAYEREAIRPLVLLRFRDLLGATAKSPAMLFYLDNWMSADPKGPHVLAARARGGARRPSVFVARPGARAQDKREPKGLNENYGRELLELHTLGVDGGFTQQDVTEVARAFTGWTIANPRQGGEFRFDARLHDPGAKVVLGHQIAAGGGMHDGEAVLDILAAHPATARFIASKLARRFVSDTPPPPLVDRLAATFTRTGGDLRAVMTVLLKSPEFAAPDVYRAKVKTPLEFVAGAIRAAGAQIDDARLLVRAVQQLGMPLYQCQPPTGYPDSGVAWVNTGALVSRMNFALTMSTAAAARGGALTPPEDVIRQVLADDVSPATRGTIAKAASPEQALALTLGSPEFQRR